MTTKPPFLNSGKKSETDRRGGGGGGGIAAEEMEGRAEQGVGLGGKHKWPHESISGFTLSIPLRPRDTWVAVEKSARERSGDGKAHISGSNERPSVKKKKKVEPQSGTAVVPDRWSFVRGSMTWPVALVNFIPERLVPVRRPSVAPVLVCLRSL